MKANKWETMAASIIKTELAKRSMKYPDLEKKLNEMGEKYNYSMIKQKIARGSFSCAFLLQCLKAIGAHDLNLTEYFKGLGV
jgi:uncharacterized protein DUF6471